MIKTTVEVTKILEADTLDSAKNKVERLESYRLWVLSLSKEGLKGVIIGFASFISNNCNSKLLSSTKEEKETAKFKVKIANIYLCFAKEVFYCT